MRKALILVFVMASLVGHYAQAKVVELDNMNGDYCRHQIVSGKDNSPIVLAYMQGHRYSEKIRSLYEAVAAKFPDKAFFSFNISEGQGTHSNAYLIAKAASECLGQIPMRSPIFYKYNVTLTSGNYAPGKIEFLDRIGIDDPSKSENIIKFIGPDYNKDGLTINSLNSKS